MLSLGIIRKSCSFPSPLHMAPKNDSDWGPCGDYRAVNKITVSNGYPLPHIQDLITSLDGSIIFSKIDRAESFPSNICGTV